MKKIVIVILTIICFLLTACSLESSSRDAVKDYFSLYHKKDSVVIEQLDNFLELQELTDEQKKVYKDVLERQYENILYEIKNETSEGDTSYFEVKITVLDLYKVQQDAKEYAEKHPDEFRDSQGKYDENKFIDYKLEKMKETNDITTYDIILKVIKDDTGYRVEQLSNEDLEKIHGIYNYGEL